MWPSVTDRVSWSVSLSVGQIRKTWRAIIVSRVCLWVCLSVCLSVCLCMCLCVSDRHFYPSTLTDFDETWSPGPYSDLVWLDSNKTDGGDTFWSLPLRRFRQYIAAAARRSPGYCNWTGGTALCCDRSSGAFQTGGVRNWGRNRAVKTNQLVGLSVTMWALQNGWTDQGIVWMWTWCAQGTMY